jgi:iron complex outermembrane receptor protein
LAIAGAALCTAALAQTEVPSLPAVTVTARIIAPPADVAGFGELPPDRLPLQTVSIGEAQLKDIGAQGVRALARMDASVTDAYNAVGYWESLTVRGFVIDQRYNYRRDGLPITGETAIPLDNKSRLELLKGTSGIQAGTSAPGGLVNTVVKRPDVDLRSAFVEFRSAQTALASTDMSTRLGADRAVGLRVNAAIEHLEPELKDANGKRHLLAVAGDWRIAPSTFVEAEFETSRRSQPSQPGFSLLGDRVPDAGDIDPDINLNNQPWSQPVVFKANYATLRITQRLGDDWRAVLHAGVQRLRTDDRLAFPFGCSAEGNFDRYCSDGSFDLYDFRSEDEKRRTDALDASLQGRLQTGPLTHALTLGVLRSRYKSRLEGQAYNFAGEGTIDGGSVTPPAPDATGTNTDRTERNTELYLRDVMQISPTVDLWLGLRHTRLDRESVQTDGSQATRYDQSFTTPWIAATWTVMPGRQLYASWGEGVESEVVPNRPRYTEPGQALKALKSRQTELGYKATADRWTWGLTAFQIERPVYQDFGLCDDAVPGSCERLADGQAVHRGIETNALARLGAWTLDGSAQWLHARLEDSRNPALDGSTPTNVPERSLRLRVGHDLAALPGLNTFAALTAESERNVLPGNDDLHIGGWARIDVGASYQQRLDSGGRLIWRAGVDNVADRRAWQESPYQFSHAYLYPMTARTWRLSLQADL